MPEPSDEPAFVARSELLAHAYRFARDAHEGSKSRGHTRISHPASVAAIVSVYAGEEVVAAALLHDVLEDTSVTRGEIEAEFGASIAALVAALTEDPSIDDYATRKRHLRRQVANAGPDAALIFLADKLANVEALAASGSPIEPAKLEHYHATLMLLSTAYPELEVAAQLRHALRSTPRP